MPRHSPTRPTVVMLLAMLTSAVFALAWLSPNDDSLSDPAIALLVSQAVIDHGTLRLDPYVGDPASAYDLETDRRIRRQDGAYAYYNVGVPLLSVPAVWIANRLGFHMLDQEAESALQNLLSALGCAVIALLLWMICRTVVSAAAATLIATVSILGSSLISTLATGLWNSVYAVLLLAAGTLHLCRREQAGDRPDWRLLAVLAILAFACRPTTGFAVAAAVLTLTGRTTRMRLLWIGAAAGAAILALAAIGAMPEGLYYNPRKLIPRTPPWVGFYGTLASPSRGLLIFSPFLIAVAVAITRHFRRLWHAPLFRFAAVWFGLHLLAVSLRVPWWGGHSYGPRMLAELMVPAALMTCLAWRELLEEGVASRRILAASYLVLGIAALWIHSWQGLFNPWIGRWNTEPEIDRYTELLFDWQTPQFLVSEASLAARLDKHQRRHLVTYEFGDVVGPASDQAVFRHWSPPEGAWRWSEGTSAEILVRVDAVDPGLYVLELAAGTHGDQEVTVTVNGTAAGTFSQSGFEPCKRSLAFAGEALAAGENIIRFDIPQAAPTPIDPRLLGLALYELRLRPAPQVISFADDAYFVHGFSHAESQWRWTDGQLATVLYPLTEIDSAAQLELTAGAFGEQRVGVRVNGTVVGELDARGRAPTTYRLALPAEILQPATLNRIELSLPDAHSPEGDSRRLGLSFVEMTIRGSGDETVSVPARSDNIAPRSMDEE